MKRVLFVFGIAVLMMGANSAFCLTVLASGPNLVLTKSGPTTIIPGQPATFGLDVQNIGTSDAWNVSLLDNLPRASTTPTISGSMCNTTPVILGAYLVASDGVTAVGGLLNEGTDYLFSYGGCQLSLIMLSPAATIGPAQHLIIT